MDTGREGGMEGEGGGGGVCVTVYGILYGHVYSHSSPYLSLSCTPPHLPRVRCFFSPLLRPSKKALDTDLLSNNNDTMGYLVIK